MVEVLLGGRSIRRPDWTVPLFGVVSGVGAVAALAVAPSPLWALLYLGATIAGVVALLAPHAALYALTVAMIAMWPGQAIKFAGAGVAATLLLWALATRRPLVPRDRLFWILAALTALIGVSALVGSDEEGLRLALSYVASLVLFWTFVTAANTPRVVQRLAGAMLIAGVLAALFGLAQYQFKFLWIVSEGVFYFDNIFVTALDPREAFMTWRGYFRIESVTGAADYLGMAMELLLPFGVFWCARQQSLRGRLVGVCVVGVLAAALVLSFTRGVFVSTALIVVPMLAVKFGLRRTLPHLLVGLLLVAGLAFGWEPLRERLTTTVTEWLDPRVDTAGGWRREILPVAMAIFADHFFTGAGVGRHKEVWPDYAPSDLTYTTSVGVQEPLHNSYLLLAVEVGVLGLVLLLLLLWCAWRRLRELQREFADDQPLADLAHAAEIAWVSLAFNMLLYPVVDATFRYVWVLFALIGALSHVAATRRASPAMRGARDA